MKRCVIVCLISASSLFFVSTAAAVPIDSSYIFETGKFKVRLSDVTGGEGFSFVTRNEGAQRNFTYDAGAGTATLVFDAAMTAGSLYHQHIWSDPGQFDGQLSVTWTGVGEHEYGLSAEDGTGSILVNLNGFDIDHDGVADDLLIVNEFNPKDMATHRGGNPLYAFVDDTWGDSSSLYFGILPGHTLGGRNDLFQLHAWFAAMQGNIFLNGELTTFQAHSDLHLGHGTKGTEVPEPATALLLGLGMLGGAVRRKRTA